VIRRVFVDTSALYAVLDRSDAQHLDASTIWARLLDALELGVVELVTHGSVVVEATALVQRRLGMEAVRALLDDVVALMDVIWVDAALHERATTALLAAGARHISLVDWTSFETMRSLGIEEAFAFDDDFVQRGFTALAA
jgi:predicted nucleic acid-binding protein